MRRPGKPNREEPLANGHRPKVLFVSFVPTHPPIRGNSKRILSLMEATESLGFEAHLFCLPFRGFEAIADSEAMLRRWGGRLVVGARAAPRGLRRLRDEVQTRLERYVRDRVDATGPHSFFADVDRGHNSRWVREARALHRKHRFAAVVAEYVFSTRVLRAFPDDVVKAVDTMDVFERRSELSAQAGISERWVDPSGESERQALSRAHMVLAIQDEEAEHFRRCLSRPVVTVGHLPRQPAGPVPEPSGPPSVVLVGSRSQYNFHGMFFFLAEVWPLVRAELPSAVVKVIGQLGEMIPEACRSVERVGVVENDVDIYSSGHVAVNPALLGTGLPIKTVEALAHGRPVVTTTSGARGLASVADGLIVENDPAALAKGIVRLLTRDRERRAMGRAAWQAAKRWNDVALGNLAAVLGRGRP